jgi:hypothetical protein
VKLCFIVAIVDFRIKMSPKAKNAAKAKAAPKPKAAVAVDDQQHRDINWTNGYLEEVKADMETIVSKWPTLKTLDALPMTGDSGFKGLNGFGHPFDAAAYDTNKSAAGDGG